MKLFKLRSHCHCTSFLRLLPKHFSKSVAITIGDRAGLWNSAIEDVQPVARDYGRHAGIVRGSLKVESCGGASRVAPVRKMLLPVDADLSPTVAKRNPAF